MDKQSERDSLQRVEWRSKTTDVELGTYHLPHTIENHPVFVDRRLSVDWRAFEELPAGEYVVEDASHVRIDAGEDYEGPPWLRMWRVQNNGTLYEVNCADWRFWVVLGYAEILDETPSRWLTANRDENWALEILDALVEHNQISMAAVKVAKKAAVAKWERENEEAAS